MEPRERLFDGPHLLPIRQLRARDQNNRQVQSARGKELRLGPRTPRIFGDDMRDLVRSKQREIVVQIERSAGDDRGAVGQRKLGWLIHQSKQVVVLFPRKGGEVLLPDRQKDTRSFGKTVDGRLNIPDAGPIVLRTGAPFWPFEAQQRDIHLRTCGNRVGTHLVREGMGRVDDMGDLGISQICREPVYAAETANSHRQGLVCGRFRAARIGEHAIQSRRRQAPRQRTCFCCAAKKENAHV